MKTPGRPLDRVQVERDGFVLVSIPPGDDSPMDANSAPLPNPVCPTVSEVLFRKPLYEKTKIENEKMADVVFNLQYLGMRLESFCLECKKEGLFIRIDKPTAPEATVRRMPSPVQQLVHIDETQRMPFILRNRIFAVCIACGFQQFHTQTFFFEVKENCLTKIGQTPSVADLALEELRPYRKLLGGEVSREWAKGIGLAAHGVGIGSFIYLRRVLERLAEDAHETAVASGRWSCPDYENKRMAEKIAELSGFLPSNLVKNAAAYGVLSKGIHELSENECLDYFPVLNSVIESILHEKLATKTRERLDKEASQALHRINQDLKS